MSTVRRITLALLAVAGVMVAGSIGYVVLGFGLLDAVYQTVTTITTVGFRELRPLNTAGKIFTIVLILAGVGTALYAFGVVLESLVEGHLHQHFEGRRMKRDIARMSGHTIICGWGRVGRAVGGYLAGQDAQVVVVDLDPERVAAAGHPALLGDVTDDDVLRKAGIMRARALVAAINTDAENVYVTLSARALRPELVIIARARTEASEPKLLRAGATRVVNPQRIGGQRIAAAALQPNVVEFLDVVMHDGSLEFRLEEVSVRAGSRLAGRTLREANVGETTGALVLALRGHDGTFLANPPLQTSVSAGHVLIAIGTQQQLAALQHAADRVGLRPGTIPAPSARAASRRHATPDPANVIRAQTPAPDDSPCGGQYLDHRCGGECLVAQHSDTTFISPLTVSAALPRARCPEVMQQPHWRQVARGR